MEASRSRPRARVACVRISRSSVATRSALTIDQLAGLLLNGGERLLVDREIEPGGKANGAEHPQLVFGDAGQRIANGADDAALQIRLAADVVDHLLGERVEEQAVDREVAALGVVLGVGERHRVGMPAVAVGGVAAERGDVDLPGPFRSEHGDDAERRPDRAASAACQILRESDRARRRSRRRNPSAVWPIS